MGTRPRPVGPATIYVAQELRAQRARLEWSLDTLAEKSGVARMTAYRALTGERALDIETLIKLCNAMGLNVSALLNEAHEQANPGSATAGKGRG